MFRGRIPEPSARGAEWEWTMGTSWLMITPTRPLTRHIFLRIVRYRYFFFLPLTADSSPCRLHIPHAHCHLFFPGSFPCVPINLLPLVHKACPFQLLHGMRCPVLLPAPPLPSPHSPSPLPLRSHPTELRLTHSAHTQPCSH